MTFKFFGKRFVFDGRSTIGLKELGEWGYCNYIGCTIILTPLFGVTIIK